MLKHSILKIFLFITFGNVYVSMCTRMQVPLGQRHWSLLELEVQMVVSHPAWMLGIEL